MYVVEKKNTQENKCEKLVKIINMKTVKTVF